MKHLNANTKYLNQFSKDKSSINRQIKYNLDRRRLALGNIYLIFLIRLFHFFRESRLKKVGKMEILI